MSCPRGCLLLTAAFVTCSVAAREAAAEQAGPAEEDRRYFAIRVLDADTGRGVPLVELETVNHIRRYTDSSGVVAFYEPGLMGRDVYFHVRSHGYEYPKDGFGYRGKRIRVEAGGETTLQIKRQNLAERLYRVTGAGMYRDLLLVGGEPPVQQPLLNGSVFGSDSVVNAVFGGKVYWFWGDTNRPSYPLGNFHVPGAVSELPERGGLDPDIGVDLQYFLDDRGFAKPTCRMPGDGPTWIGGLMVAPDGEGRERMLATYVKVKPPLTVYERGLVQFNDEKKEFEKLKQFDLKAPVVPQGHPFHHQADGVDYVYFGGQYPLTRAGATLDALTDPSCYQCYTYFKSGSRDEQLELDRDEHGELRLAWRTDSLPPTAKLEQRLVQGGRIRREEMQLGLRDIESGQAVNVHSSSVAWNRYRQRWVMIALQSFGDSPLGEIWYSEAPQPTGPWKRARKLVTHDKYSFYNPKQHAFFAKDEGRVIYFEATYTTKFSGNPVATPRYDYNQIMYKVDLSDPRLAPHLFDATAGP